jgi:hypothetical protein
VVIQSALLAKPQAPADRAVNWALFVGAIAVILGCSFWSTSMSCTSQCNQGRMCTCTLNQDNSDGSDSDGNWGWIADYFYAGVELCGVVILAVVAIACVAYGLARAGFI